MKLTFFWSTFPTFLKLCCSYAKQYFLSIISGRKQRRFVWKQVQSQPHIHSTARFSKTSTVKFFNESTHYWANTVPLWLLWPLLLLLHHSLLVTIGVDISKVWYIFLGKRITSNLQSTVNSIGIYGDYSATVLNKTIPGQVLPGQPKPRKPRRPWTRAVFSNLQRKGLEKRFQLQKYLTKADRHQLASMLGLSDNQVKVWFQNRRMKWRQDARETVASGSSEETTERQEQ